MRMDSAFDIAVCISSNRDRPPSLFATSDWASRIRLALRTRNCAYRPGAWTAGYTLPHDNPATMVSVCMRTMRLAADSPEGHWGPLAGTEAAARGGGAVSGGVSQAARPTVARTAQARRPMIRD